VLEHVNVRARGFFVARNTGWCLHCGGQTRQIALAFSAEHATLIAEEELWQNASASAVVFFIGYLSDEVSNRLREIGPSYRFSNDLAYWANHCELCDAAQRDDDLYCEPEGAFGGPSAAIDLFWIDEPIEAAAGGYSYDPAVLVAADE
jgi:hypothetical protein